MGSLEWENQESSQALPSGSWAISRENTCDSQSAPANSIQKSVFIKADGFPRSLFSYDGKGEEGFFDFHQFVYDCEG